MNIFEIVYVSFIFTKEDGSQVEKTKSHFIFANDEKDAEQKFNLKTMKSKKIISIQIDKSNTLGNICPQLLDLRNKLEE